MKKVKIMLMSLAVLAIVGGALAFKAAKFTNTYCTLPAQFTDNGALPPTYYCPNDIAWVGSKVCADLLNVKTQQVIGAAFTTNICYTPKPALATCGAVTVACTTKSTVYQDN